MQDIIPANQSQPGYNGGDSSLSLHCKHCDELNLLLGINLDELEDSARSGCTFCNVLLRAIKAFANNANARACIHEQYGIIITNFPEMNAQTRFHPAVDTNFLSIGCEGNKFYLEVYSPEPQNSTPWKHMRSAKAISGNTSSDAAFEEAQKWLEHCEKAHGRCKLNASGQYPDRILDISRNQVKLREVVGLDSRYACLSHCWGSCQPLRTTLSTLPSHKRGIEWHTLPKTFQDVITLLRRMHIEYVWIDSLCIVQDDEDDWKTEAAKMGDIYAGAFVTIAATQGRDSRNGLYSLAPGANKSIAFQCPDPNGQQHTLHVRLMLEHGLHVGVSDTSFDERHPLLGRGWVYQERLLSPRVLHFGAAELIWECREASFCECAQAQGQHSVFLEKLEYHGRKGGIYPSRDSLVGCWRKMVVDYTTLNFTFEKDALVAMMGLAREMQTFRRGAYLCGLWEDSLIGDLLWESGRRRIPDTWQAPSWSWASCVGSVNYGPIGYGIRHGDLCLEKVTETYASVVEAKTTPAGPDVHGPVESAQIVLHAAVAAGKVLLDVVDTDYTRVDAPDIDSEGSIAVTCICEDLEVGADVLCLQMVAVVRPPFLGVVDVFLVLRAVDGLEATFTRVGIAQFPNRTIIEGESRRLKEGMTVKII